jgi:hypothetical protein
MTNLNLKNKALTFSLIFLLGCTTNLNKKSSFFIVKRELDGLVEIVVTPDRLLSECVDAEQVPDEGRFIFWIYMLDEENTVLTSFHIIKPSKKECEIIRRGANRVLKNAERVYIGNRGSIASDPRVENRKFAHTFPGHGTFYDNGRSLTLEVMTNDKGECFNPFASKNEPCLEYPFPIEKHEERIKSGK